MNRILIIDDEVSICDSLQFLLEDTYEVYTSQDPEEGLKIIVEKDIQVILLDLKIGNIDGIDVLKDIKEIKPEAGIIIVTAYGSIESTVKAIKLGASNYVTKPINIEELNVFIEKALDYINLNTSLINLKEIVNQRYTVKGIIGRAESFKNVLEKIEKVKDVDTTVLITGESGTGKDVIAKAIHFEGSRKNSKLEIVNCAAIPDNLLESELFGYEKGAFTGAEKRKIGKIEQADNGTLFLDEIGDMNISLQAKILRVVEDMEITPLGSHKSKKVNVRIIAATNKDLIEEVKSGRFREDLYYRLNVITLELPPLRKRREDIILLTQFFLKKHSQKLKKTTNRFSIEASKVLESYDYPGNIRELENIIERTIVLTDHEEIKLDDLPDYLRTLNNHLIADDENIKIKLGTNLKEVEKIVILKTLEYFNGNRRFTAECLKMSERSLQYKIKEYDTK